jgi:hypothetical protein
VGHIKWVIPSQLNCLHTQKLKIKFIITYLKGSNHLIVDNKSSVADG